MTILSEAMQQSEKNSTLPLRCDICGGVMKLVRSIPRLGAHPELATYQCEQCRHVATLPVEDKA